MSDTYKTATGFFGDKLYQQRAREALPILVRQAKASVPIYYENLAAEMGMPNPRNLNYPLGCIGDALNELALQWDKEIPHIQALVRNRQTGFPGPGFDGFLEERGYSWRTPEERRAIIRTYWAQIANYPYWDEVLAALCLTPTSVILDTVLAQAASFQGGGEGPEHKALKEFVQRNPYVVGLGYGTAPGETEVNLPSGDRVDVFFDRIGEVLAIEVKSAKSSLADIVRGLFQCVKYQAVLRAQAAYNHDRRQIRSVLVLGSGFPIEFNPLRNILGVEVIENLRAG